MNNLVVQTWVATVVLIFDTANVGTKNPFSIAWIEKGMNWEKLGKTLENPPIQYLPSSGFLCLTHLPHSGIHQTDSSPQDAARK